MAVPDKAYADDMAVLSDLTEESLLHELKRRYERNIIYVRDTLFWQTEKDTYWVWNMIFEIKKKPVF